MNKRASLTPEIMHIVCDKSTEMPYTGRYHEPSDMPGTYLCRQCGLALYRASSQFLSSCGWPSFDDELQNAITKQPDADGHRTEILCSRCDAHLGHIFQGEHYTEKNIRHCVNSLAIDFVTDRNVQDTEEAILAAGCFWGIQYYMDKLDGILATEVGYTGGTTDHPTYEAVCRKNTGHVEAIRIIYDPSCIDYETLIKYFFEIHDPTQPDGQGPDKGEQYLSHIFYYDKAQKNIANDLMTQLTKQSLDIATTLVPVQTFWPAEEYHQDYYIKKSEMPYCHRYVKRFF